MAEKLSDFWLITYKGKRTAKVIYPTEVTKEEAMSLFEAGEYEDVIDEFDDGVVEVDDAETVE